MDKIGIIGAGQLGYYLGLEAHKMGYMPIYLDPNPNAISKRITNTFINKNFDDLDAVNTLASQSKVVTYEFENVDNEIVKKLYHDKLLPQGYVQLEISNARLTEKNTATNMDILVPKFAPISSKEGLLDIINQFKLPCILKTNRLGYDGKGQFTINQLDDINNIKFDTEYILEEKISFDYELSIIGVRSVNGEIAIYEPIRNVHKDGILHFSFTETNIDEKIKQKCEEIVQKFLIQKDIYGILCCELFVVGEEVYFNEIAPRPHNSGHITMDTHITSQYENHLRAILGLPLGSTKIKRHGVMVNVLGDTYEKINDYYSKNTKVYDYKKAENRPKRKMGHVNYIGNNVEQFLMFALGLTDKVEIGD